MTVKQGQVELQHEDNFDPSFADAILIDRGIIESLNSTIRKLAEVCRLVGDRFLDCIIIY